MGDINRLHGESEPCYELPHLWDPPYRDNSSENKVRVRNRTHYRNFLSVFVALTLLNSELRA